MMTFEPKPLATSGPSPAAKPAVVPQRLRWHGSLAAWTVHRLVCGLTFTLRLRYHAPEETDSLILRQPAIFSIWHNRLALALPSYCRMVRRRRPDRRMAAMVSASKDGALVARILEHFSAVPIRGSSSRRGSQALRELITQASLGRDLAITPDGPRGPRHQVQDGVIGLAQMTGLPIIPANCALSAKIQLRSWDRFQIPLPFARWDLRLAAPVWVPREADAAERERLRLEVQERMLDLVPADREP
ncbi:MAG: lysophospholipid acyltransferase family protein [Verrucomicrobia bacterium]|nr:lysophospholipid acyltransferase family protein [Verrucomicrobiota bacterium]MBI3868875.1 lysophospholipid acyltransferase family protein [Verrucomicrobiota bacterium]